MGCKTCVCASPDTPIATPQGEIAMAQLEMGDLVFSLHHGQVEAVPIRTTNRTPVDHHQVLQIVLANGKVLEISAGHPTADGRSFAHLQPGDWLDCVEVRSVRAIPYSHPYTYDILPDSDTGTYFAAGVLIGSTLSTAAPVEGECSRQDR